MPSAEHPASAVFRLRVCLIGLEPQIWRLLDVDADLTLPEFHDVLQIAFGWRESHLHRFTDDDPFAARPDLPRIGRAPRSWAPEFPFEDADDDELPEAEWSLAQVFDGFDGPLFYEYDFGDGWVHAIELIERSVSERSVPRAVLLRGERRGPWEDSGGIAGYTEKLAILADAEHPEHREIAEWVRWVSGPWFPPDPDQVDVDGVNGELAARFDSRLGMSGLPTEPFPGDPRPAEHGSGPAGCAPLLPAEAAIIDMLERLPVSLRSELRVLLRSSGALEPADIDATQATAMMGPVLWLVGQAGEDGIRLTKAGRLPPAVVTEAMAEFGWSERTLGTVSREDKAPELTALREEAVRFGLLRKRNGLLQVTAKARGLSGDPVALWRMLADTFLRRIRSDVERDLAVILATDVATGRKAVDATGFGYDMEGVAFALGALGWGDENGGTLQPNSVAWLVYGMLRRLDPFEVFEWDRWNRGAATAGGRAFARAILRSTLPA